MKISAKRTNGPSIEVDYDFGNDLDTMVSKFGKDIVFNHAKGSFIVALQGWLRNQITAEKKPAEIQAGAKTWKPGQRKPGKSPMEKLRDQLLKMPAEDRASFLKELKTPAPTGPKAVTA